MGKFRANTTLNPSDYLALSGSTSASLSYASGIHTLTTQQYDAYTGENIGIKKQIFTTTMLKNKITSSLAQETALSQSRESMEHMLQQMKSNKMSL